MLGRPCRMSSAEAKITWHRRKRCGGYGSRQHTDGDGTGCARRGEIEERVADYGDLREANPHRLCKRDNRARVGLGPESRIVSGDKAKHLFDTKLVHVGAHGNFSIVAKHAKLITAVGEAGQQLRRIANRLQMRGCRFRSRRSRSARKAGLASLPSTPAQSGPQTPIGWATINESGRKRGSAIDKAADRGKALVDRTATARHSLHDVVNCGALTPAENQQSCRLCQTA